MYEYFMIITKQIALEEILIEERNFAGQSLDESLEMKHSKLFHICYLCVKNYFLFIIFITVNLFDITLI